MGRIHDISNRLLISALIIVTMTACVKVDEYYPHVPDGDDGREMFITMTFDSPGVTRATHNGDESNIETIDVMVFDQNDHFLYRSEGRSIEESEPGTGQFDKQKFLVTLLKSTQKTRRLVIIANARDGVLNAPIAGHKDYVLNNLTFEITGNDNRWPVSDEEGGFRPIPMWGESSQIHIDENTGTHFQSSPIELYRAVARIDLTVSPQVDFVMTNVLVYNYNTRGCVAPGPDADWFPHYVSGEPRVRNVTLPSDPGHILKPLSAHKVENSSSIGQIYLLETHKANPGKYQDATSLIIEGHKRGSNDLVYYRLDLRLVWVVTEYPPGGGPPIGTQVYDEGGWGGFVGSARTFPHVLRNHIMEINIDAIESEGFLTTDDAFARTDGKVDMSVGIRSFQRKYVDVEYKSDYFSVSVGSINIKQRAEDPDVYKSSFDIIKSSKSEVELEVESDGWLAASITGSTVNWSIVKDMSAASRIGYIIVKVDNVSKKIKVTVTN